MCQTLKQFILWEITKNNTLSLIAKIRDYSTLNSSASIWVRKGVLFGIRWMKVGFLGGSQRFCSLSPVAVSSKGSKNYRILWWHLLLSTVVIQDRQYPYMNSNFICREMFWWELSNVYICKTLFSATSNCEFIREQAALTRCSFFV